MSLPIQPRNPAISQYVFQLDAAYRSGMWLPDQDFALRQDVNVWEVVRRDPIALQAIEQRLHKVAGKDWIVAPASRAPSDQRIAAVCEEWLSRIDGFAQARYNLAKAIFRGRSFAYPEGERRTADLAGISAAWWLCDRVRDIDPRRMRYMPEVVRQADGTDRILVHAEMWSLERHGWIRIDAESWQSFVRLTYDDDEAQLGHGRGVLNAMYFYLYTKTVVLREGMQGLERWAQGVVEAKIKSLRNSGSDNDVATQTTNWLDAIERMRSRHALVSDADDTLTVHETTGSGHQMVLSMLEYLDQALVRCASGSLLPSGGGGSVGSNARAEVEEGTSEDLVQFDRALLDEAITRDLIGNWFRISRPQLVLAGLADAKCPRLRSNQLRREDPEKSARIAAAALQARIPLRKDEVYAKLGYTMPSDTDPVFEGGTTPFGGGFNPLGGSPETSQPAPVGGSGNAVLDALRERARRNAGTDEAAAGDAPDVT